MKKKLTKYTMQKHAARVLVLLSHKDPCGKCPASFKFNSKLPPLKNWIDTYPNSPCVICKRFSEIIVYRFHVCPCNLKGQEENVKQAWLKLEELGMI